MVKNSKYFLVIIAILCICVNSINAQQMIQLTQNTFNTFKYNPGFAGQREAINVAATFRSQWTGFGVEKTLKDDGATDKTSASPSLYMVSADMPIKVLRGGIGLNIVSDNIGASSITMVELGYAYQHEFIGGGKLGIGAQVLFNNFTIDKAKLIFGQESDPVLNQMGTEGNDFIVDCNFGIYYSKPNSFFGGLSAYNLIESQGYKTTYKGRRSFNAIAGYTFRFPANPKIKITPSVLVKTDLSTFQLDASAILSIQDQYWIGANYRLFDGLGIVLGIMWKDFRLGYSYDIPMSRLSLGGSWGSHEVVLGYSFKLEREKGKLTQKNTRYL